MKLNYRIITYIQLGLFVLVALFFTLGMKDSKECLENPFTYGANDLQNPETGDVMCICNFENSNYAPFYFDKDNVSTLDKLG